MLDTTQSYKMTSQTDFTTISVEPSCFGTGIGIDEKITEEKRYRVDIMEKTITYSLSMGAVLSLSLLSITLLFFVIFIATLIYPFPFVSTKLALFISFFSGALGVEVLVAKKIKCPN